MLIRRVNNGLLEMIEDNVVILTISEKIVDNEVQINLSGVMKNNLAYELDDELSAAVTAKKDIALDLSGLSYIASASLKILLRIQQQLESCNNGQTMKLVNVSADIMKIFDESGLSEILDIKAIALEDE